MQQNFIVVCSNVSISLSLRPMIEAGKRNIRHLSFDELNGVITGLGEKPFRARQTWDWIWKKGVGSIEGMSNLSKPLREKLANHFDFYTLSTDIVQKSNDGTVKMRFRTYDGHAIEGVLIPAEDRVTACVSSQVGCSLTCAFCATGQMERKRNLNFDEIFDQVVLLNKASEENLHRSLTNIVFMGMGEPLLNYSNVMKANEMISSPEGLGMSPRRITVSTAGVSKMIQKLGEDKVRFRLALSLHAANDEKRNKIMPINEHNNLNTLIESLNFFYEQTGNRISFEYILFNNFNDSPEDARELIKICKQVPARVNLIEYNTVNNVPFTASGEERADKFLEILTKHNITATIRRSRGKDIDAACGQLANK
jgi:23S rRNA (adenine2503-C2)-methyltransferase